MAESAMQAETLSSSGLATRPTRVRHGVVVFAVTLAVITYIDRVCISQAAPSIRSEFGLTESQMGLAFAAFYWAYALFEVPTGWMGDRWGARRILMRVVVWWSVFTAATGRVWNLASLVGARALFGAGEAGCFPNVTRMFTTWLPAGERVRAQAIMWLSARWAGAITPPLVFFMMLHVSWRHVFAMFGGLGIVWAVLFFRWYRDDPRQNPAMNEAERAILPKPSEVLLGHEPVPWGRMLASRTVWLLWAQYALMNYGWAFYITWMPTYLQETRGVTLASGAVQLSLRYVLIGGIPLFCGGLGSLFSGYLASYLERTAGNPRLVRRVLAMIGFGLASTCLAISARIAEPAWAMLAMGVASFANDLAMPPSWAACMDVGGRISGTLSGSMNMIGNFGSSLAPIVTGFLLAWTGHNWSTVFYASAAAYGLGTFCWLLIDPVTPLMPAREQGAFPVQNVE